MHKVQILCLDPPYGFYDKINMSDVPRGAEANYNVMSNQDILNLPVKEIVDPEGCLLALWVPSSLLSFGLQLMETWGFQQKQTYIWVKTKKEPFIDFKKWTIKNILKHKQIAYDKFSYDRAINSVIDSLSNFSLQEALAFGMGRLFRQTHEICLIGINNTKIYKQLQNKSQRSVSFAENLKHSAKPEALQNSLETMFPNLTGLKVELFARRQKSGWLCLGNQSPISMQEDIIVSLNKLQKIDDQQLSQLQQHLHDVNQLTIFWNNV